MDHQLRSAIRRYHSTQNINDHARAISIALHFGELQRDKIALCAYLGHQPSRILFSHLFQANTFYYFQNLLRVDEPVHVIYNLRHWGRVAPVIAVCGVIKGAFSDQQSRPEWFRHISHICQANTTITDIYQYFSKVLEDRALRTRLTFMRYRGGARRFDPDYLFETLLYDFQYGIHFPGTNALYWANAYLEDATLASSMVNTVASWALGEYI